MKSITNNSLVIDKCSITGIMESKINIRNLKEMKNKPIKKSWKIIIDLKYDFDSFTVDDDLYELGEHPQCELERKGWFLIQCPDGWRVQNEFNLHEGEQVIEHPEGDEYVFKVYKKTSEAHRDSYLELKEEWQHFQAIIPMLRGAIRENRIEECKILIPRLKYNWINAQDDEGDTFLHIAVIYNADIEICKLLIDKMAIVPINVQNDDGLTAYQIAKKRGYDDICELLEDKILEGGKK